MVKRLLLIICLAACALRVVAQTPGDVPQGHWAYTAVMSLAGKGYVNGYPDGKLLADRTLSRYEFATLVKRVLDNLGSRTAKSDNSSTSAVPEVVPAPDGVSAEDLATVKKLVDEFKVELTVIGTNLDKVSVDLADMQSKVENVNAIVTDPEGALESTRADVAKLKKISFGGLIQTRYQTLQNPEDKTAVHTDDTFRVRRARLKVNARPTDKSMAVLQFDMGDDKMSVKDAYVQYNTATDQLLGPSYLVGQQNWWFGYEVPTGDNVRETPERALWARRFFPNERDRGFVVTSPFGKNWFGTMGVYDGSGTDTVNKQTKLFVPDAAGDPVAKNVTTSSSAVANDYNNQKDVLVNLKYSGPTVEYGLSGYFGEGIWNKDRTAMDSTTDKVRYGADFRYYLDNITFKAEYCRAKGIDTTDVAKFNPNTWVDGYNGQVNFNVTRDNELVARYESLSQDPLYPDFGRRSAWNLGVIHFLDDSQKIKLFYQINNEQKHAVPNNGFIAEWLLTY